MGMWLTYAKKDLIMLCDHPDSNPYTSLEYDVKLAPTVLDSDHCAFK